MKPNWFENDVLTNKVYRRTEKDVDGLSVAPTYETAKLTIVVGRGVASLLIGDIEQLNLKVVEDDDDHGHITGIPFDYENYDLAMELADKLLGLSIVTIDRWNRRQSSCH